MTSLHLSEGVLLALRSGAWLSGGTLIGAFYFLALRRNVAILALGHAPLCAMALALGRFAFVAGLLVAIASHFGTLPLLLTTAGIVAVHPLVGLMGRCS